LQAEAASLQMVMIPKTEYDEIKKKQGDVKQDGQTLPSINEPQAPQTQAPVQPQAPGSKPAEPPASTDKPQPSTVQSPTSAKSPASSQVHTIAASSGTQPPPNVKAAT
ncbi:hypothetical protein MXD63_42655, partial [Frankia sp. Cpl3]|nr:hypothetical protein [Frankia sp. Cpl3]